MINSLAYSLVIDPATGYVAYASRFSQPVKLTREQLSSILGQPKFEHSGASGEPWDGAYAWEKFENAARLAKAGKSGHLSEANWWLQAAWAVRLDVVSGGNSFDDEVETLFRDLPYQVSMQFDMSVPYELRLAEYYQSQRADGEFVNLAPERYALCLAWLYRSRGELQAARSWLARAREADEGHRAVQPALRLSKQQHQPGSRIHGTGPAGLPARLGSWRAAEQPALGRGLSIAELKRRLGQRKSAALWYTETELRNQGEISRPLLARLLGLSFDRGW